MKQIGYHVDRSGKLYEGLVLNLDKDEYSDCYNKIRYFDQCLPNGISSHGRIQLADKQIQLTSFGTLNFNDINSAYIEQIVEFIRIVEFPSIPSRYESAFLVPKLSDIKRWKVLMNPAHSIFEVEYDSDSPLLDAYFLRGGISDNFLFSPCSALLCAENYLSGKMSSSPMPEILVRLPVTIGKCIGSTDSLV